MFLVDGELRKRRKLFPRNQTLGFAWRVGFARVGFRGQATVSPCPTRRGSLVFIDETIRLGGA
jgi:hypothetical protein